MRSFIDSPVWASLISVAGAAIAGLIGMMTHLTRRVSKAHIKLDAIIKDMRMMKADKDIVRWSQLQTRRKWRRRNGF